MPRVFCCSGEIMNIEPPVFVHTGYIYCWKLGVSGPVPRPWEKRVRKTRGWHSVPDLKKQSVAGNGCASKTVEKSRKKSKGQTRRIVYNRNSKHGEEQK